MSASIDADASEVIALLNQVRDRIMDYRLQRFLSGPATAYMRDRINRRFADEGDDVVGSWAQLREATRNIRARQGYGASHPINVRTGALFRFVKTSRVSGTTLTMPGKAPTGQLRQKLLIAQAGGVGRKVRGGSQRIGPNRPTVPRPVIGLNDRDRRGVETRLLVWIHTGGGTR